MNRSTDKKIKMKIKETLHGKLGHVSVKLYFNSDSESDPSDGDDTEHLNKHPNIIMTWCPLIRQPFNLS